MAGVGHGVVEGVGVMLGLLVGVWVADGTAVVVIMMVDGGAVVGGGSVGAGDTDGVAEPVGAGSVTIANASGDGRTAVGFKGRLLSTPGTQAGKIQSRIMTKQGNSLFMTDFPREL